MTPCSIDPSRSLLTLFACTALACTTLACTPDSKSDDELGSGSSDEVGESGGSDTETLDCSARPIDIPTPRADLEGVWDAERERMVFFAGDQGTPIMCMSQTDYTAEVWAFHTDCDNFERIEPGAGMPARGRYALAHDLAHGRALIHGGRTREGTSGPYTVFDDLWAYELATDTWTELAKGPSPRSNHVAAIVGNRLVVHGGNASSNGLVFDPLGDTWAFDLDAETWSQVTTSNDPPARLFHSATVGPDDASLVVYGGGDENAFTMFLHDMWVLQLAADGTSGAWTMLGQGASPPPGPSSADLVLDPARNRLVLWAGHEDNLLGNTNALWAYDLGGGSWSSLITGDLLTGASNGFCDFPADFVTPDLDSPERRSAGVAVLMDEGETLLIFGGKTDCGLINDVWSLNLADHVWTERSPATGGEICLRAFANCQTMCF